MRTLSAIIVLMLSYPGAAAPAQDSIWRSVNLSAGNADLRPARLTISQRASLMRALRAQPAPWSCREAGSTSWRRSPIFLAVPLGSRPVTLVQAGQGCARGAQGANGAMWLFLWRGSRPAPIAAPGALSGWFRSVEPPTMHGMHDLTIGWHLSSSEMGVTYLRFNGTSYQSISTADVRLDNADQPHILNTTRASQPH